MFISIILECGGPAWVAACILYLASYLDELFNYFSVPPLAGRSLMT